MSWATLAVGAVAVSVLIPLRFVAPRLPAALIVVAGAILASWALDLESHGVAVLGDIPAGLPSLELPGVPLIDFAKLVPAAIGLSFVCFADGILTARSFAGKNDQHVRAGQELLAFVGIQAAAGVSQGLPVGASSSRTAVNDQMGARTQVAGLLAAGAVAVVLLFLTALLELLPSAVLGAVIIAAALGLIDLAAWRALGERRAASVRTRHGGRRRLPARRPALLCQRALRQGPGAGGGPRCTL